MTKNIKKKKPGSCIWCGILKTEDMGAFYCSRECQEKAFDFKNKNIIKKYEQQRNG